MEDKNFKELFEDLIQSVKMCEKNDNNCFKCEKVYFQNSDCFITNPIYSDLYDAFSLIIKNDSEGDEKVSKVFSNIGKIFEEKNKEISRLGTQLAGPKSYPWETCINSSKDRFTEIIEFLQRGELPPLSFNTD